MKPICLSSSIKTRIGPIGGKGRSGEKRLLAGRLDVMVRMSGK